MRVGGNSLCTATRATVLLIVIAAAFTAALAATAAERSRHHQTTREVNRALARELRLTDLALMPGTSYTRHPSQADLFAPFSDHPSAIEHFPAGSISPPPANQLWPVAPSKVARPSHPGTTAVNNIALSTSFPMRVVLDILSRTCARPLDRMHPISRYPAALASRRSETRGLAFIP